MKFENTDSDTNFVEKKDLVISDDKAFSISSLIVLPSIKAIEHNEDRKILLQESEKIVKANKDTLFTLTKQNYDSLGYVTGIAAGSSVISSHSRIIYKDSLNTIAEHMKNVMYCDKHDTSKRIGTIIDTKAVTTKNDGYILFLMVYNKPNYNDDSTTYIRTFHDSLMKQTKMYNSIGWWQPTQTICSTCNRPTSAFWRLKDPDNNNKPSPYLNCYNCGQPLKDYPMNGKQYKFKSSMVNYLASTGYIINFIISETMDEVSYTQRPADGVNSPIIAFGDVCEYYGEESTQTSKHTLPKFRMFDSDDDSDTNDDNTVKIDNILKLSGNDDETAILTTENNDNKNPNPGDDIMDTKQLQDSINALATQLNTIKQSVDTLSGVPSTKDSDDIKAQLVLKDQEIEKLSKDNQSLSDAIKGIYGAVIQKRPDLFPIEHKMITTDQDCIKNSSDSPLSMVAKIMTTLDMDVVKPVDKGGEQDPPPPPPPTGKDVQPPVPPAGVPDVPPAKDQDTNTVSNFRKSLSKK